MTAIYTHPPPPLSTLMASTSIQPAIALDSHALQTTLVTLLRKDQPLLKLQSLIFAWNQSVADFQSSMSTLINAIFASKCHLTSQLIVESFVPRYDYSDDEDAQVNNNDPHDSQCSIGSLKYIHKCKRICLRHQQTMRANLDNIQTFMLKREESNGVVDIEQAKINISQEIRPYYRTKAILNSILKEILFLIVGHRE